MNTFYSFVVAILWGYIASSYVASEVNFEEHLSVFSTIRHPIHNDGEMWRLSREYIKEKLQHFGLKDIREQRFNTSIGRDPSGEDAIVEVEGVNIIVVREGISKSGPIIVVAADYDTALQANPLKNNGGGVACFLETIRLMEKSIRDTPYILNNTIIYVAFDLNTYEYYTSSGKGPAGSYFFVHHWLNKYMESEGVDFLGAVVLDSVTTYNPRNESQEKTLLRDGFDSAFPEAYKEIQEKGSKGDFLGVVYRIRDAENQLVETFIRNYHTDRKAREFRLQQMEFQFNLSVLLGDVLDLIQHQSQFPFWTYSLDEPLPAILLFDTEDDRLSPYEDETCNSEQCDSEAFLTRERQDFMEMTTVTLTKTLLELQAVISKKSNMITTKSPDNGAHTLGSTLLIPLSVLIWSCLIQQMLGRHFS